MNFAPTYIKNAFIRRGAIYRALLCNRVCALDAVFDEVLLMQSGKLIAQGTLAQLAATSPEFQQLMRAYERSHAEDEP